MIAINAQIYSQSGGLQGLAFALPIDVAPQVEQQIVTTGHVEHARLGVMVQDVDQALAECFGLKSPAGALISSVARNSAAARADLKSGDVITQIDGQQVSTASDVSTRIGLATPGKRIHLTVWRDKASREVDVTLGAAPDTQTAQAAAEAKPGSLGLAVRPLTPAERREVHADHGLLVEDVDGAAARAGIRPGDIVLALNGRPINDVEQIRKLLATHKAQLIALAVATSAAMGTHAQTLESLLQRAAEQQRLIAQEFKQGTLAPAQVGRLEKAQAGIAAAQVAVLSHGRESVPQAEAIQHRQNVQDYAIRKNPSLS